MKKIAMVMPYTCSNRYSVNVIAAVVDRLGFVDTFLLEGFDKTINIIKLLLNRYDVVVVGISLNTFMLLDDIVFNTINELKKLKTTHLGKNLLVIAGGPHASGDPLGCLKSLGFDAVIIGEGEKAIAEFLKAIVEGNDPYSVKGVAILGDDDKIIMHGKPEPINLDESIPFPFWRNMWGPIEITRGCPYGCYYCQVSYMHGFRPRHRSIENIVYYCKLMALRGYRDLRFIAPDGLGYGLEKRSREPALEIIEELLYRLKVDVVEPYGARIFYGTFPSEIRPEHVTKDAIRVLRKYVANKSVIIGAQSGSDNVLKRINRGHTVDDVFNAVSLLIGNGFKVDVDFILGLPGETRADQEETLNVMKKLVSMGARIHLHVFMPLPGTPFACEEPGKVPEWLKREVSKLIGIKGAYGQWERQEEYAQKIAMLRDRGIILTCT